MTAFLKEQWDNFKMIFVLVWHLGWCIAIVALFWYLVTSAWTFIFG